MRIVLTEGLVMTRHHPVRSGKSRRRVSTTASSRLLGRCKCNLFMSMNFAGPWRDLNRSEPQREICNRRS
jgi:hypothetical protein